jgi:hypothetical protein
VIEGTPGIDVIVAMRGNDEIKAGAGADIVCGGDGRDAIDGGLGEDTILGNAHKDTMSGGLGSDQLVGGGGGDKQTGGEGADVFEAGSGNDGHDVVVGGQGADVADYGDRDQRVVVAIDEPTGNNCTAPEDEIEAETVIGGDGGDILTGAADDDTLLGGDGNDVIAGKGGDDVIRGGSGDDAVSGGSGTNDVDGGAGNNSTCVDLKTCDKTPPELVDFSIVNDEIDTSHGPATVTFRVSVSDNLSGPTGATLHVSSPDGKTFQAPWVNTPVCVGTDPVELKLHLTVPQQATEGTWQVGAISINDWVRHNTSVEGSELVERGFEHTFDQTGPGKPVDSSRPEIVSQSFSSDVVDTSGSADFATLQFHLTDEGSGIDTERFFIELFDPNNRSHSYDDTRALTLTKTSGTLKDGNFETKIPLPRYSPQGEWKVNNVAVFDKAMNYVQVYEEALEEQGLAASFMQTGIGDSEPPTITAFSVTPAKVDTTDATRKVHITITVVDEMSGISSEPGFLGNFGFYPVEGGNGLQAFVWTQDRISGTRRNGTYRSTSYLARYSAQGEWKFGDAWIEDAVGNRDWISAEEFEEAGFDPSFTNGP